MKCVGILLNFIYFQRGVALTTRDKDGNTAFSLAVKNKHDR